MKTRSLLWSMLVMMMAGMMSVSLSSCGDDDGDGWSNNTTDVAVTGSATDVTFYGATVQGVVNLNQTTTLSSDRSVTIKVEYAEASFYDKNSYFDYIEQIDEIVGNKVSVELVGLNAETDYKYRVSVEVNGVKYVGETRSFHTQSVSNIVSSVNLADVGETYAYFNMKVDAVKCKHCGVGIMYSKSMADLEDEDNYGRLSEAERAMSYDDIEQLYYYYSDNDKVYLKDGDFRYRLTDLEEGTTYYYRYFTYYGRSEKPYVTSTISSFKTQGKVVDDDSDREDGNDVDDDAAVTALLSMYNLSAHWRLENNTSSQSLGVTKGEIYYIMAEGSDDGIMMDSNMNTVATLDLSTTYPQLLTVRWLKVEQTVTYKLSYSSYMMWKSSSGNLLFTRLY